MPLNIFGNWKNPSRIKILATCVGVAGVLGLATFVGWRLWPEASPPVADAVPTVFDTAQTAAATAASAALSIVPQQASVAAIVEVIVGRNDTLDAIFRRMSLNKSDLAAIRNLPGIRQSMDYLKPGDSINSSTIRAVATRTRPAKHYARSGFPIWRSSTSRR